ncbi:MAG: hypothetical protein RSD40_03265 [Bacilli bacterium]
MENKIVYILLAAILFFLQNWIGSRSYSRGYIKFSLLDDQDEALSFNYVLKVFGPIVYLILVTSMMQYFNYNVYISGIINVVYYYIAIRIIVIFIYERWRIVNWYRIIIYYFSIIIVSEIIYNKLIISVNDLLPDFSNIKDEVWLLIIIFIYQLGNGFEEKYPDSALSEPTRAYLPDLKQRKKRYILRKYSLYKKKYIKILNDITIGNKELNIVFISIIIFENFNRPQLIRWLENLLAAITKKEITQGIMQVYSNKYITDVESIKIGSKRLYNEFIKFEAANDKYKIFGKVIKKQCPDRKYIRQILFIAKCIIDNTEGKCSYPNLYEEIEREFDLYEF